jgi:hypothetical protein
LTEAVQIATIVTTGSVLVAVITAFGNKLMSGQRKLADKQDDMSKQMDGRLSELLELTRKSSRAEGAKEELDRVK